MISTILIDFYGVFTPDAYNDWLMRNSYRREGVFAELIADLDKGAITETAFLSGLSKATGRQVDISEIHSTNTIIDLKLVSLVRALKSQYKIALLSNASTKLRSRLQALNLTSLFDEIFISGETGVSKPNIEAYEEVMNRLRLAPSEILFIDDNPINVSAAKQAGIESIHYISVDALNDQLQTFLEI